ncbi:MAG: GEVED domain-containing protein, partial [Rubripirellula sp.]
ADENDATHSGAGIRFDGSGDLTLRDVAVRSSQTNGRFATGGGVFFRGDQLLIVDSEISGNQTTGDDASGGGLFVAGLMASIQRTSVMGNSTSGQRSGGGGIAAVDAVISLERSEVEANLTSGNASPGGGIHTSNSELLLMSSAVFGNSTSGDGADGGGVAAGLNSNVGVLNTTLASNQTTGDTASGGAFAMGPGGSASFVNATIVGNTASGDGGGIFVTPGASESLSIANSVVAQNVDDGTAPDLNAPLNPNSLNVRWSLIGDNTGTLLVESQTADAMGNLVGDVSGGGVIDPLLGPLGIHGGATSTLVPLAGSPLIDGGSDALAVDLDLSPLQGDQRGTPFQRKFGTVDLGAFEVQPPQPPAIEWLNPANIFVGTPLSSTQLNASSSVPGTFVYSPDAGTVLPEMNGQTLSVMFTPDDLQFYSVTTAMVSIDVVPSADLGDAPDSYGTLYESDGPRHLESSLRLGATVDFEVDGQPSSDAAGDDFESDDEDGVSFISSVVVYPLGPTTASVMVRVNRRAKLDAWIDFNGDGIFQATTEHLGLGTSIDVAGGNNVVSFTVPFTAIAGDTFARFRVSDAGGLLPTGEAEDGEVEDYALTILNGFEQPTVELNLPRGSFTLSRNVADFVIESGDDILFKADVTAVGSYQIVGDTFSNVLTIDQRGGEAIPAGGLVYDAVNRVNTLRLLGQEGEIDLSGNGSIVVRNIDVIDLTDSASTTLVLSASSVREMDTDGGGVIIVGEANDQLRFDDGSNWRMGAPFDVAGFVFRIASLFDTFVQFDFGSPWQNVVQPSDVNNDGTATASDALRIINELARRDFSDSDTALLVDTTTLNTFTNLYFDQNGDGAVTALDALRVINGLSQNSDVSGEQTGSREGEVSRFDAVLEMRADRLGSGQADEMAFLLPGNLGFQGLGITERNAMGFSFTSSALTDHEESASVRDSGQQTPPSPTERATISSRRVDQALSDAQWLSEQTEESVKADSLNDGTVDLTPGMGDAFPL